MKIMGGMVSSVVDLCVGAPISGVCARVFAISTALMNLQTRRWMPRKKHAGSVRQGATLRLENGSKVLPDRCGCPFGLELGSCRGRI